MSIAADMPAKSNEPLAILISRRMFSTRCDRGHRRGGEPPCGTQRDDGNGALRRPDDRHVRSVKRGMDTNGVRSKRHSIVKHPPSGGGAIADGRISEKCSVKMTPLPCATNGASVVFRWSIAVRASRLGIPVHRWHPTRFIVTGHCGALNAVATVPARQGSR